ncbi:MAG TPA: oxygenase MpaB family protein [Candidatus Dormibacteraeota bacterium]|nr:oxygenase MpaB family protein [Candidatus Dormibacteraeota bacterium]
MTTGVRPTAVDFGLFGPGSTAWLLHREPGLLIGGLRALMVQALHPLAIAAVEQHSDYRNDVWGRFNRTSNYVVTTVFGNTEEARAVGRRVRAIHRPIHGIDRVTGLPYAADDPVLLLWIHTTLVESFVLSYQRFVRPLGQAQRDRYVAEMVRQAELVGLRPEDVPDSWAANFRFIESQRAMLQRTQTAMEALDTVLHPPLPVHRRPGWWALGQCAISLLPDHAVEMYGLRRNSAAEAGLRPLVGASARLSARLLPPHPVMLEAQRRVLAAGERF